MFAEGMDDPNALYWRRPAGPGWFDLATARVGQAEGEPDDGRSVLGLHGWAAHGDWRRAARLGRVAVSIGFLRLNSGLAVAPEPRNESHHEANGREGGEPTAHDGDD